MKETVEKIQNLLKYYGFEVESVFPQEEETRNYDGTTQQGIEIILHSGENIIEAMNIIVRDMCMGASGTKKGFVIWMNEIHQKKNNETYASFDTVLDNLLSIRKITCLTSKVKCFKHCVLDSKKRDTSSFISAGNATIDISVPPNWFSVNKKYNVYIEEI